ncbi:MAG: BamA/TamA family outer membrane protein [Ferruginibacter sp.]
MNMPCGHKYFFALGTGFLLFFIPLLSLAQASQKNNFLLHIHAVDKDSSFVPAGLGIQTAFTSETAVINYIFKIPRLLASKGYPAASIDSQWTVENITHILLYTGTKYNWINLRTSGIEPQALSNTGFNTNNYSGKVFNVSQVQLLQEKLISYYENKGYPFASVYLDSIIIEENKMHAVLKADKSIFYHIDSIRVLGKLKINNKFLQRYLDISNGSIYSKEKLQQVDTRILELQYVNPLQPSDLTMLGSGSVLNLYLQPKRSSQVNVLIGFLPSANQSGKLQVTGDVNLDLQNLLAGGENILVKWQQLQVKSPRLNLGFSKPYIFNSPFGFSFLFDLFKKDSSFLQLNAQTGAQFNIASNQSGKLFVQWQSASLLSGGVDTNQVKTLKKLPVNIDVTAVNVGLNYEWIKTDYRYNPRSGNEINLQGTAGIKNISKNNDIISIKDPSYNYASLYDSIKLRSYQIRVNLAASHYFSLGKLSAVKTAINTGIYQSPTVFRNELFQVGGYKLLRGFDEESIYATKYAVLTAEYRYLIGLNSFLFFFSDMGVANNKYQAVNMNNQYIGAGLGIRFETKAGLLNISYAVGKRDDVKFNLRESSKLHFGYINYF